MLHVCILAICILLFQTFIGIFIEHFLQEDMVLLETIVHLFICSNFILGSIEMLHFCYYSFVYFKTDSHRPISVVWHF